MTETLAKIHFLKALGADRWGSMQSPLKNNAPTASVFNPPPPPKVRELKTSTRTIELVFFLRVSLRVDRRDGLPIWAARFRFGQAGLQQDDGQAIRSAVEYRQHCSTSRRWLTIPAVRRKTGWPTSVSC
ncbi:hypothetical protein [Arthrobacter methylotrophus]|uniref:hypothetical protein n=1 Tax=Arthrobacter methylotrophus TaxID=121291 RepID=UPI0031E7FE91